MQATDRGVATLGHDGGVHVSDQAIRVLLDAVAYHLGLVSDAYPIAGNGLPALLLRAGVLTDPFGPAPLWATTLPATAVVLLGVWRVWSRPDQRTLLATSGLVMLGVLCFHIPATALLLAALVPGRALAPWPSVRTGTGRSPRGWSPIGSR